MKRWVWVLLIVSGLGLITIVGFYQIQIDALQEPGNLETIFATQAKQILIYRSSRDNIPPAPADLQISIEAGDKFFGTECAQCHGFDGRTATDAGRWMYPRAADLTSPQVQQYSDQELFWIIKYGIRLSGMPAFGKVESDEHIWNLTHYTRTLRGTAPVANEKTTK
jgi:mono/diheme cytochrome c family protein